MRVEWDSIGTRAFETGIDRGMLYIPVIGGVTGVAWNGLLQVSEAPSGGTPTDYFVDGQKYLSVSSVEEYAATVQSFYYPVEFAPCAGLLRISTGLYVADQPSKSFGFSYRTLVGNDLLDTSAGYKIHLVYNASAKVDDFTNDSITDVSNVNPYSWELTTTPVDVDSYKPTSHLIIDSRKFAPEILSTIEDILYGTDTDDPRLMMPTELVSMLTPPITVGVASIRMKNMRVGGFALPPEGSIQMKKRTISGTGGSKVSRVARLIGFDVAKGDWTSANATIGPGNTHRLFYSSNLPPTFDGDGTPDDVVIIVSYKAMNTNVASYIASIPPARKEVWMVYYHEPEDNFTGPVFNANFRSQANLIHAQGDSRVKVVYCAMAYQYGGKVNAGAKAGDYALNLGNGYADIFGVDIYQGQAGAVPNWDWTTGGIATFDQWINWTAVVTNPAIVGTLQPLAIIEYGVDDPVGNANRLARIELDYNYLISAFKGLHPISPFPLQAWLYWWQSIDANAPKFTDADTIALWQSFEEPPPSQVVIHSTGIYASTVTEATCKPNLPLGVQIGDLVYIGVEFRAGTGNINAPAGWTPVVPSFQSAFSASTKMAVLRRVMQAGDSGPTISNDANTAGRYSVIELCIKGADTVHLEDGVTPTKDDGGASAHTSVSAPSITPTTSDDLLLIFFGAGAPNAGQMVTDFSTPAGMIVQGKAMSAVASVTNSGLMVASKQLSSNAATGVQTSNVTSSVSPNVDTQAVTLVIKPA